MRQSIRALGWAVTISTLLVFTFLASAIYSIFQLVIVDQGIRIGNPQVKLANGNLTMLMPIMINNTGFYDISEFEIATTLKDPNGAIIATNTTRIAEIKKGDLKSRIHVLSLSPKVLFLRMRRFLFNDTEIKMLVSAGFKYAYALGFQISMVNITMPWGAPFHGLTLKSLDIRGFNGTHLFLELNLRFENRFFSDIGGSLHLMIYNEDGELVGEGIGYLYAPSGGFEEPVLFIVTLTDPESFTGKGYADLFLQIPIIEEPIKLGRINYEQY